MIHTKNSQQESIYAHNSHITFVVFLFKISLVVYVACLICLNYQIIIAINVPVSPKSNIAELQIPKPTITSPRNTEVIDKHAWRKQTEKKKKYESDLTSKNVGHTTPISRRNSSSSSPNIVNKSRNSVFPAPAPAPAPAHSAPTQLDAQNGVRSSRDSQLCHIGLAVVVLIIFNCD